MIDISNEKRNINKAAISVSNQSLSTFNQDLPQNIQDDLLDSVTKRSSPSRMNQRSRQILTYQHASFGPMEDFEHEELLHVPVFDKSEPKLMISKRLWKTSSLPKETGMDTSVATHEPIPCRTPAETCRTMETNR